MKQEIPTLKADRDNKNLRSFSFGVVQIAETNIARLQKQKYKLFPNEVLDTSLDSIVLYNKLKVYGAEFKSLVENQDLLNFIRLESI